MVSAVKKQYVEKTQKPVETQGLDDAQELGELNRLEKFMLEGNVKYLHSLATIAMKYGLQAQDRDNIMQELFIRVGKSGHNYDPDKGTESAYISRIYYNLCIDFLRKKKRNKGINISDMVGKGIADVSHESFVEFIGSKSVGSKDYDDAITIDMKQEKDSILRESVESLTEVRRDVIKDFYWNDLSYKEIAKKQGIPIGTVKSRMHGATKDLAKILKQKEPEIFV
ncbi:sigma-70 family RNA polymerase sigma factor [Candidatus Pacearchaeota archaeon]|nr:sigma-70 family RNA polymerase sigma factor [Candidatus Pacearchaeota archaeon]